MQQSTYVSPTALLQADLTKTLLGTVQANTAVEELRRELTAEQLQRQAEQQEAQRREGATMALLRQVHRQQQLLLRALAARDPDLLRDLQAEVEEVERVDTQPGSLVAAAERAGSSRGRSRRRNAIEDAGTQVRRRPVSAALPASASASYALAKEPAEDSHMQQTRHGAGSTSPSVNRNSGQVSSPGLSGQRQRPLSSSTHRTPHLSRSNRALSPLDRQRTHHEAS